MCPRQRTNEKPTTAAFNSVKIARGLLGSWCRDVAVHAQGGARRRVVDLAGPAALAARRSHAEPEPLSHSALGSVTMCSVILTDYIVYKKAVDTLYSAYKSV